MKTFWLWILVMSLCLGFSEAEEILLTHVNVVDVKQGTVLLDRTIRISGERIAEVLKVAPASTSVRTIDLAGKFVIPGLWDMHTHYFDPDTPGCPEATFPLTVAFGVTGIRDVGGYLDLSHDWRRQVTDGKIVGPRVIGTGLLIDGTPVVYPLTSMVAPTPEDGRRLVQMLKRRGADFVKAYEMLPRDIFVAVMDEAKKQDLPVVAHVPLSVLAGEASDLGVRSMEHLRNIELACSSDAEALLAERTKMIAENPGKDGMSLRGQIHRSQRPRALDTIDMEKCTLLLRKFAANHTWQTPTLFNGTLVAYESDLSPDVRGALRYVPRPVATEWLEMSKGREGAPTEVLAAYKRHADWLAKLVGMLQKEHVGILAGTDISTPWIVPGIAVHWELQTLVSAGLTPAEALRTSTTNPAEYFDRTADFGSISAGHFADLVILDANPLDDIRNTRKIHAVIANGAFLDRKRLDELLVTTEKLVQAPDHATPHQPR